MTKKSLNLSAIAIAVLALVMVLSCNQDKKVPKLNVNKTGFDSLKVYKDVLPNLVYNFIYDRIVGTQGIKLQHDFLTGRIDCYFF